jgi:hypothetical protein
MNLKNKLAKNYINFRGWKTNRKIVVIESDDWGSVRIANQEVVEQAIKLNSSVGKNKFLFYDGLEKQTDLESLFELLSSFKDYKGNHPVVTALALTSNPNFEAMKGKGDHIEYKSESITDTYQKYGENQLFSLWKNCGVKSNLLYPQFHGKEHLFVNRYLKRINNHDDIENFAFQHDSIFGVENTTRALNFLAAFEYHSEEDKKIIEKQTEQGLESFKELFGFYSKSFCPSQSIYGEHIYPVLKRKGIITLQAGQQFVPNNLQLIKVDNFWGNRTKENLIFTRRNCTFETYKGSSFNHVDECLKEIEIAFRWKKPAVINSHRVNFTSRLRTDLRDQTLMDLKRMITEILKKWPDVEFVNSAQLADIMLENKS